MMQSEQDSKAEWEQISLEIEQSQAEELASLLGEIIPGGVVLEKLYGDLFPHELDQYQGPIRLSGYYLAELSQEIRERVTSSLEGSGHEGLLSQVACTPLPNRDWATAWQERYHPIPIGDKLIIVPTWLENPTPERIPIWMAPGMAFGSGTHPTTRLSLSLLEQALGDSLPDQMIDMGCGSGILTIAAARLGVKNVLGLDLDPDAITVSENNARKNEVSSAVSFQKGSVGEILGQEGLGRGVPLLVANIIAPILLDLFADGLAELVLPGGRLILSGILVEQLPEILSSLESNGFTQPEVHHLEDWVGLIAVKMRAP